MELLHSDLIPHTVDGMVHHPLVIQLLPEDATHLNQLYRQKVDKLAKAEADYDWSKYIFLHERPYQCDALLAAAEKGLRDEPSVYWALVGRVWLGSENIYQNLIEWKQLWGAAIEGQRACMSVQGRRILKSFPEQIEVWRGTSCESGVDGLSWTIDEEKAVWFAKRFCSRPHVPFVAKGVVNKADVLAYFEGRNESEIISIRVSIISVGEVDHV